VGLAAATAAVAGALVTTSPAQAAALPCYVAGSGNSASAGCFSGSSITWRLVVDCYDRSSLRWPFIVNTVTSRYVTGDGSVSVSCAPSLSAQGRLEVRG
jgi:hypothetical protein